MNRLFIIICFVFFRKKRQTEIFPVCRFSLLLYGHLAIAEGRFFACYFNTIRNIIKVYYQYAPRGLVLGEVSGGTGGPTIVTTSCQLVFAARRAGVSVTPVKSSAFAKEKVRWRTDGQILQGN